MLNRLFILLIGIAFLGCSDYSRNSYPKEANVQYNSGHQAILFCNTIETTDLTLLPDDIESFIHEYYNQKIGEKIYQQLDFYRCVISNNKFPLLEDFTASDSLLYLDWVFDIKKDLTDLTECDTSLTFPIYHVTYNLQLEKFGVESLMFYLIIDANKNVLSDIQFPDNMANQDVKFIPIDAVHKLLIERNIPSNDMLISFIYDDENAFFWVPSTKIAEGSILGPSCFPTYQTHFRMNAITGEVTEIIDNAK